MFEQAAKGRAALAQQGRQVKQGPANNSGTGARPAAPGMAGMLGGYARQPGMAGGGAAPAAPAGNARPGQVADRRFAMTDSQYRAANRGPVMAPMAAPPPQIGGPRMIGPAQQQDPRMGVAPVRTLGMASGGMGRMLGGVQTQGVVGQSPQSYGTISGAPAGNQGTYVRPDPVGQTAAGNPKTLDDYIAQWRGYISNGGRDPATNGMTDEERGDYNQRRNAETAEGLAPGIGGDAVNTVGDGRPPAGGTTIGSYLADLASTAGTDLGRVSSEMSRQDIASAMNDYDNFSALDNQDTIARDMYGSDARAAAEAAARQDLYAGINDQRDQALRMMEGRASRGGAVGSSMQPGIYNAAMQAASAGERGLAQDKFGRDLASTQQYLDTLSGTTDRRYGIIGDERTSRKELLSMILESLNPLSQLIPGS